MEGSSIEMSKVGKECKKSKPPPLVRPQPQYRRPVIIHTYSPKIIETDPSSFMWLVQRLTGSSDTRIRCEGCKPAVLPKDMPVSPTDDGPARKKLKSSSNSSSAQRRQQQQQQRADVFVDHPQVFVKTEEQLQEQQPAQQILLSPSSSSDSGTFGGRSTGSPNSTLHSYEVGPSQDDHHHHQEQQQQQQQAYLVPTEPAWSSVPPTPSQDFLADLSSLFDIGQGLNNTLDGFTMFGASPRFPLQSPASLAYRDWALSFAKDTATF